jgi:NADH-quinone oxidoreductase subunit M
MLRMYIRSMHNRVGANVASREISARDGAVLVPLVLCILAFALYPQKALEHSEPSVKRAIAAAGSTSSAVAQRGVTP